MKRRQFLETGIFGLGALSFGCSRSSFLFSTSGGNLDDGFTYLLSHDIDAPNVPLPADMRVPFNWNFFGLHKEAVTVKFTNHNGQKVMPALFRISTAIDVREQKLVEVFLP